MSRIVGLVFEAEQDNKKSNEPSVNELKEILDKNGIEYDKKAKKADLLKLLEDSQGNLNEGAGQ
ncbi:HeH/LEM domain-containing protein [Amedibacillus sp. YH-ame6]